MDAKVQITPEVKPDPTTPAEGTVERITTPDGKTIDRFQSTPQPKPEPGDRPKWLAEKFKTPDDLATATRELMKKQGYSDSIIARTTSGTADESIAAIYADLEKKQGSQKTEEPAPAPETKPAPDVADAATQTSETLKAKGIEYADLRKEFVEQGALSDETYSKLEKAGWTRDFVDSHVAGLQALAARQMETVAKEAGGTVESYQLMTDWAKTGLTKAEAEAFNRIIDSGRLEDMKVAARGLWAKYEASEGRDPQLVGGGRDASSDVTPFRSWQQVTEAMKDPRYAKGDPAYHAEIDRRLAVSSI